MVSNTDAARRSSSASLPESHPAKSRNALSLFLTNPSFSSIASMTKAVFVIFSFSAALGLICKFV